MTIEAKSTDEKQSDFLGREAELKNLQGAWNSAVTRTPQMRILAAESGYGKTRLVQAFYAWLTTNHDSHDYWPPALAEEGQNLRVMPQIHRVEAGKKAPWFWWGMRWVADPDGRNLPEERSPFISSIHAPSFTSHQNALLLSVKERKALGDVIVASAKVLLGITGLSMAKDLMDAADQIQGFLGILERRKEGIDLAKGKDVAEAQELKRILTTLALLLDPLKGNKRSLPVILILDDAHWMDAFSVTIIDRLWAEARARKWPLLVIATSWQTEWNKGTGFSDWARPQLQATPKSFRLLPLKRMKSESIELMLSAAFPGLTNEQKLFFAGKADGNPRHAKEITMLLKDMAASWFEDGDVSRGLTKAGFAKAQREEFALERLERNRFRKVEEHVKDALGAGSAQGEMFLCEFALEVARELGLSGTDKDALEKAENPFALAEAVDSASMEFRSRFLHQLASEHLTDKFTEPTRLTDAIATVGRSWMSGGKIQNLHRDKANRILGIIAAASKTRSDEVCATAHALALFGKDQSGWFLAQWKPHWLRLRPSSKELKLVFTEILRDTAKALWKTGEKEEALRVALEVEHRASTTDDPADKARYLILSTYMKGELQCAPAEEISTNYKEVVRLREVAARIKKDAKSWRRLALAHNAFGRFLVLSEATRNADTQKRQAREQFEAAIEASRRAVGQQPAEKNMLELANSFRFMAEFLRGSSEDLDEAYQNASNSVLLYREILGRHGRSSGKIEGLAFALLTQASIESDRGNHKVAIELVDDAVEELEALQQNGVTPTSFNIYESCLRTKACSLIEIGRMASALKCLRIALQACNKALSVMPSHPDLQESRLKLSTLIEEMRG